MPWNRELLKACLSSVLLLVCGTSFSQTFSVNGKVTDETSMPLKGVEIKVWNVNDSAITLTDKHGIFTTKPLTAGIYYRSFKARGFNDYNDTINLQNSTLQAITLHHTLHPLDEVKIVARVLAAVQKDDTVEFNSGAYKVNPDADAADLVKKMPSINVNGSAVTAQGETVTKVVVDGKPFFGSDPYAALKNLPADIIDKVQVYNEKSDQEQFTGFREGPTTKTINVITKPGRKNGVFGKLYGGGGEDDAGNGLYGAGFSVNKFEGDQRITVTGQANNVNIQSFSDESSAGGSSVGFTKVNGGGMNYTDKWGKKMEVNASYFFNETDNTSYRDTRKTYVVAADSGQVYNETSPASAENYAHRANMRINYLADSFNSVLFQPQISFRRAYTSSLRSGSTEEAGQLLNQTTNTNGGQNNSINFSTDLLLRHKFRKKGRTLSADIRAGNVWNQNTTIHTAEDIYYASTPPADTINQRTLQHQNTWTLNGNATYTEPVGKNGQLKAEYNISYAPALSERNTDDYSPLTNSYSSQNLALSSDFTSRNTAHKGGASYRYSGKRADFSVGLYYQFTQLSNTQQQPAFFNLDHTYQNPLPVATFQYKFSKAHNLQCNYTSSTQTPSVTQLQNVVNNTDPLHLYIGDPSLQQPYRHNLTIRYNASSADAKNSFSAAVTGSITQHSITTSSIIAAADTTIEQNHLTRGTQLTMPVNVEGARMLTGNVTYAMPLQFIKCRLNIGINGSINRTPTVINGQINYQANKNGGIAASIASNISENIDFTVSTGVDIVANVNSINPQLSSTYANEHSECLLNVIFWKGFVFNTSVSYQSNTGLAAGYNQDYVLWNAAIGKKLFKKHRGDIRFSVHDLLAQNNSIQHTVTDIYLQDTKSNVLQRYYLLTFTYKLNEFKKSKAD